MNISVVCAHPDDAEILCAGTMIRYVTMGHRVTLIIATNGEMGSVELGNKEIAKMRSEEAAKSAEIMGVELILLGFQDEFLFDCRETRISFLNALRKSEADVVFTHYKDYYNCDHNAVHKITNDVGILQNVKNIKTEYPPTKNNPYLYFMDTICCRGFDPDEYVDITEVFEIKKKALMAHKSQYSWLGKHSKIDYIDMMKTQSKIRGYQSGVKYAEGFIGVKTFPRVISRSLLPQYL